MDVTNECSKSEINKLTKAWPVLIVRTEIPKKIKMTTKDVWCLKYTFRRHSDQRDGSRGQTVFCLVLEPLQEFGSILI